MCGISGYIGESKNLEASFIFLSKLFEKLESRGLDAAGYWMTESGDSGSVLYHKQPGKSSDLVKSELWKNNSKYNLNLAIVHARGASRGYGDPNLNRNNHPFVNNNKNIALVHNGKIDDLEYNSLIEKYKVKTDCDSEILLRIFEYAKARYSKNNLENYVGDLPYAHRMAGIKDIFSVINTGHMAVSIGEYDESNNRCLWLFRNKHRPLWVVDLRIQLGQIFFVSEPSIWHEAMEEVKNFKTIIKSAKICEIPHEELWFFNTNNNNKHANVPVKYMIAKSNPKLWKIEESAEFVDDEEIKLNVITTIKDEEEDEEVNTYEEDYLYKIEKETKKIQDICNSICVTSQNLIRNNTLSLSEAEQILSLLEEQNKSIKLIDNILS